MTFRKSRRRLEREHDLAMSPRRALEYWRAPNAAPSRSLIAATGGYGLDD
jgi:hypothetical protein